MMIRLLTEEVQASETSLQRAEREYLSSLWAAATFPASCLWCKEFRLTGRDSLSAPTGHRSFLLFRLPLRVGAEGQVA